MPPAVSLHSFVSQIGHAGVHCTVQLPQCSGLESVSTHWPPQHLWLMPQTSAQPVPPHSTDEVGRHWPWQHFCPFAQASPHDAQLASVPLGTQPVPLQH